MSDTIQPKQRTFTTDVSSIITVSSWWFTIQREMVFKVKDHTRLIGMVSESCNRHDIGSSL